MRNGCVRITAVLGALPLLAATLFAPAAAEEPQPLRAGEVLDQTNWQKAEGLLPPEVLEHYRKGEYANTIADWPDGLQHWGADFDEGTSENRGRFSIDERGSIVEKATSRMPSYIIGFPFPDIDPEDPHAGVKILWNYFYQFWYNGNVEARSVVKWIGQSGLDRSSTQEVRYLYYDAQPRLFSPPDNPNNLRLQFLAKSVAPADLYGTTALSWRFRDGDKQDLIWSYVPALRRVRQISSTNRSDGFLGSDLSQDDGPFFDGKPEDFIWKLAGETEMFRLTDPYSLHGDLDFRQTPDGHWYALSKDVPRFGYQLPGWKGVAWAPVAAVLARRKMWIVEGTPRDRYYLYGRILLYIDKEIYEGTWNRKFDWSGNLVSLFANGRGINHSPNKTDYWGVSPAAEMMAENLRMRRATAAGPPPDKDAPFSLYRLKFSPNMFSYQELIRATK